MQRLLAAAASGAPLLLNERGEGVGFRALLAQAQQFANQLPEGQAVVNLCRSHQAFLVTWMATLLRRQQMVLPSDESGTALDALRQLDSPLCLVNDCEPVAPVAGFSRLQLRLGDLDPHQPLVEDAPALEEDYWRRPDALLLYTSGSTGCPRPQPKSLHQLWQRARTTAAVVLEPGIRRVLSTVPLQHMYGLENGLLLPLVAGLCALDRRPFYPADIAASLSADTLLVSTPGHLRYCFQLPSPCPPAGGMLSATAPLASELALSLEERFDCQLVEVYGSTETGVVATRRTALESLWTPLPGLRVYSDAQHSWLEDENGRQPLSDRLQCGADGRFLLSGRNQDLAKIAGKRHSFAGLTQLMLSIEGVEDAVVFAENDEYSRLSALVVSRLSVQEIRVRLRPLVDPVFLPRPLLKVDRLPRNASGKLPRSALLEALADARASLDESRRKEQSNG
ncbi:AMP-binding protein [Aestuariirhabdus litorea]|uniref:AMP-dependent synthetase/ligase domain-containing protein n=1 Tax=Aestuariirhabdus litorea TaxID=2528527 RepID=A0A3P3VUE0_9GAMM|nr:AMP-binding protein [Aestuariirhabdus litorea]RRJ85236.1 hypothetical protein D0544_09270 [Aestuariirhabdus litorea]RWW98457.1 hypothetical protein DZC74_09255 [Endozoicomonadaceae bacterium GTF-13]